MRWQINTSVKLYIHMFLCFISGCSLCDIDTNRADVALTHLVCVTSSLQCFLLTLSLSLMGKHMWATKMKLQLCFSSPSISSVFYLFLLFIHFTDHTHTQSGFGNPYQVCKTAGCSTVYRVNVLSRWASLSCHSLFSNQASKPILEICFIFHPVCSLACLWS